ncbi:spore protease YyaC [Paenibacillus ehimensis]|uniref:Spore protease YyaC n=1 Tax=Paenibacillus ehimensis TaxID=79264 RepID=A0ABT8VDX5_9BACL|nr:spore protease YyaC [Paenibacillus ehimensis]MDO3679181.1 spore protease YyaC [Paenibacillus ehimensis]
MGAYENTLEGVKFNGIKTKGELTTALLSLLPGSLNVNDVVFLCIGTDRCTGDSLGPFVGTYLTRLGYKNVVGTIDEPAHAINLTEKLAQLPIGKKVIAIDATLGKLADVGSMSVYKGSIKPGGGVKRTDLPYVGDYCVTGVVNVGGCREMDVLHTTRLSGVMKMAQEITSSLVKVFPLKQVLSSKRERNRLCRGETTLAPEGGTQILFGKNFARVRGIDLQGCAPMCYNDLR